MSALALLSKLRSGPGNRGTWNADGAICLLRHFANWNKIRLTRFPSAKDNLPKSLLTIYTGL